MLSIKKKPLTLVVFTILVVVLPLLYISGPLKVCLSGMFPSLFKHTNSYMRVRGNIVPMGGELTSQVAVEGYPFQVIGDKLVYEWEFLNGTARITWSGSNLMPVSLIAYSSNQGVVINMYFTFEDLAWVGSITYQGYSIYTL